MAPKKVDKDEKRAAIVDAAKNIFARKGYNAATMEDISVEAGIAKGTTYLYFDSKDKLFLAVFDWYVERLMGITLAIPNGTENGAMEKIDQMMDKILRSMKQNQDIYPLFMEFWSVAAIGEKRVVFGEYMRKLYMRHRKVIGSVIEQGKEEGVFKEEIDSEAVASILVGAFQGLMIQACLEPDMELERLVRILMTNLVRDLAITEN